MKEFLWQLRYFFSTDYGKKSMLVLKYGIFCGPGFWFKSNKPKDVEQALNHAFKTAKPFDFND